MFQGSAHVAKAEHIALVQAAGGTMNGTTWLDRTNYFETLPSPPAGARALARGGPDGDAARRAQPGEPRQPARGREEREALELRQPAVRDWNEKLQAHLFPPEHPYHHPTIGSMEDLDAASLDDVKAFFRTYYAPNNAVLSRRRRRRSGRGPRVGARYFGGIPANPDIPPLPRPVAAADRSASESRETVQDQVPLPRVYFGFRAPVFGDPPARRARPRRPAAGRAARAAGSTGGSCATSGSPRTSRCSRSGSSAARRSRPAGRRSGRASTIATVEAAYLEELERLARSCVIGRRARPRQGARSRPTSWARCRGSRSGPTGCRCTRRCSTTPG